MSLQWRHNGHDSVSNHQPFYCLLNRLFRRRSKKTSKLRVTGLSAGSSPATGEFPTQVASNVENVSIWWRHHGSFTSCIQSSTKVCNRLNHDYYSTMIMQFPAARRKQKRLHMTVPLRRLEWKSTYDDVLSQAVAGYSTEQTELSQELKC